MKHLKYFSFLLVILFSGCNLKIEKKLPSCYDLIKSNMENSNYNEVINLLNNSDIPTNLKTDWYYYDYAVSLYKLNMMNVREALKLMKIAYQFEPKSYEINFYLGKFYFDIGENKKALKFFLKCKESQKNKYLTFEESSDFLFWVKVINELNRLVNNSYNINYSSVESFAEYSNLSLEEELWVKEINFRQNNEYLDSCFNNEQSEYMDKTTSEFLDSKLLYIGLLEKNDNLIKEVLNKYSNKGIVMMTSKLPMINEMFYKYLTFYYWFNQDGIRANNSFHIYKRYHYKPRVQKDVLEFKFDKIEKEFSKDYDFLAIKYFYKGGHLFAIAAKKSCDFGYNGLMTGFAANKKLLNHYCEVFEADHIRILHPFQFAIDEENAKKIMEVYDYEWTDEQI